MSPINLIKTVLCVSCFDILFIAGRIVMYSHVLKKALSFSPFIFLCSASPGLTQEKFTNEAVMERIAQQIQRLQGKSLSESLEELSVYKHYFWPGAAIGANTVYPINDAGRYQSYQKDVKVIFSTRVFRKCLQDLGKLPEKDATAIINRELEKSLTEYMLLSKEYIQTGPAYGMALERKKGEKPVIWEIHKKILALILIAETLELKGTQQEIVKIAKKAIEQKKEIEASHQGDQMKIFTMLVDASLLNTPILASGLYGTLSDEKKKLAQDFAERVKVCDLVDWTAPQTEYDEMAQTGLVIPLADKEYLHIPLLENATDEDVAKLLQLAEEK